jgi:hypothetical protein
MSNVAPGEVISTILKHDAKVTSYKIALLRAINDVVLSFPDLQTFSKDVAVPLRVLAEFWLAYYWPFVERESPILQGPRSMRDGKLASDIAFREELAQVRAEWDTMWGQASHPSDGFVLIHELRIPRKRKTYPKSLVNTYHKSIRAIASTIKMPIRYAGPGQWSVFDKPMQYGRLGSRVIPIPGTQKGDVCLVIQADLWRAFQQLSLYVEALCIHEWCLFTERVQQEANASVERGQVYRLLTERPDNRRPLTWERNQVDLLIMEGKLFRCPWTGRRIREGVRYEMDHLFPVSVYPINDLWNLVPADPDYNAHVKRNRLPTTERLTKAEPHLKLAYTQYDTSRPLAQALREDVDLRFSTVQAGSSEFPAAVTKAVVHFIDQVASTRNLARF